MNFFCNTQLRNHQWKVVSHHEKLSLILGISYKGSDLENIIEETKSGMSFSYDNYTGLKNYIYECFIDYQQGVENIKMNNKEFLSSNIAIKIDKIISKL